MEKDIKTIKNWVTFLGVMAIITILVGLHTITKHRGEGAGGGFYPYHHY